MSISADQTIRADDFIDKSERDANPSNDSGRVPKLENDGKLDKVFVDNANIVEIEFAENITQGDPVALVFDDVGYDKDKVYMCEADVPAEIRNFYGFAVETKLATEIGKIVVFEAIGSIDIFSGLTPGSEYFIDDAGELSTTGGTYKKSVGVALSVSTLLLNKKKTLNSIPLTSGTSDFDGHIVASVSDSPFSSVSITSASGYSLSVLSSQGVDSFMSASLPIHVGDSYSKTGTASGSILFYL